MTPIFMLKNAESRFDGRHDEFNEYLRTEYGSPNAAWILADGAGQELQSYGQSLGARLRRWFAGRIPNATAETTKS